MKFEKYFPSAEFPTAPYSSHISTPTQFSPFPPPHARYVADAANPVIFAKEKKNLGIYF